MDHPLGLFLWDGQRNVQGVGRGLGLLSRTGEVHVPLLDGVGQAAEAILVEVGRRLLSRRSAVSDWQSVDVEEHRAIAAAVAEGRAGDAELLMARHVRGALRHWEPEQRRSGGTEAS